MKIGIDVDGILRDFCDGLTTAVKKYYPEYIKETEIPDEWCKIKDWHLENNFNCTKEDLQQIYWYDHAETIMGKGKPIKGSIEKMKILSEWAEENGHDLVCVTSQKPHARHYTLSWLGNHGLNFDTVYFRKGRQKWKVDVDYLVDDSPSNWDAWVKGRGMEHGFILMDRVYNKHIKSNYRINKLDEVMGIIDAN